MTPSHALAIPRGDPMAERAFTRAAGAPLVAGNAVRVLLDAEENYPAWLAAIRAARRCVLFENYILAEDEIGVEFARALIERAKDGVRVRLLYDWMGSRQAASAGFWRAIRDGGVEVRCFNPPSLTAPTGWLSRDHRKMIAVDGEVGFVTGLCVSQRWLGVPEKRVSPWRDTGVEIRGPAVAYVQQAFAQVWRAAGSPLAEDLLDPPGQIAPCGDVPVRIVAGEPSSTGLFRLDQMIAAAAQRTLWLTDAYFVGFIPYVQALRAAARDGVDVRLLVPSTTDIPAIRPFSRAGYRPLLEAGVRVFEWNGSMIHAKTAVADGRWARVGSSNLNIASFIGNYELDAAIEHEGTAQLLEDIYLRDLENSTEITLGPRRRALPTRPRNRRRTQQGSRTPIGALRFANALGAAVSGSRALGAVESGLMNAFGFALLALSVVAVLWPRAVALPLAALAAWLAISLFLRAFKSGREARRSAAAEPERPPAAKRKRG